MKQTLINTNFNELLDPLGQNAANFFLAASLYFVHKTSFSAAAGLSELSFDDFNAGLKEHFNKGFMLADEDIEDDITTISTIQ